jgi:hypothetical protein
MKQHPLVHIQPGAFVLIPGIIGGVPGIMSCGRENGVHCPGIWRRNIIVYESHVADGN